VRVSASRQGQRLPRNNKRCLCERQRREAIQQLAAGEYISSPGKQHSRIFVPRKALCFLARFNAIKLFLLKNLFF